MSIVPVAYLALIILQTPGSLVSGIAIGAMIPLLVVLSLCLTVLGLTLIVVAYKKKDRIWHLVLATLVSSSLAVLVFLSSIFDFRR
jgi:hypothetical protein